MLLESLDKNILEMKEVFELEKSSYDVQRQDGIDRRYNEVIDESYNVIKEVKYLMEQLKFTISETTKEKMQKVLRNADDALKRGIIQESTASYIKKEVYSIKKDILNEWTEYYHQVADSKIKMLHTVKGIMQEKEKADYATNKIKFGESWDFKQDKIDKMVKGLQEAEDIVTNLGLNPEVMGFLDKVAEGNANIDDLKPDVLGWLLEKNMSSKLAITFK